MQIIMIAFRTRQGGRLTQALLSAGSTWHARPLAASVCTVVPAAAVATGYSRTFVRPMRRLTHQPQLETVGKRHPRSLTRQGFDASVFRKRGGNRDRGLLGVLYPERILRMIHTQNEGISVPSSPSWTSWPGTTGRRATRPGSVITRPCSASAASWRRNTAYRS